MAHYFKSKLNDYTPPQEWLKATRAIPQKGILLGIESK